MILLRKLAELNILGSHLLKNPEEVRRYRSYGAGRAKLLVNKIEELGEGASTFDLLGFSHVANEGRDEMYVDMPIGSFYNPNIRDVAISCGSKDIYDKYYDISSTYCHGEWAAIGSLSVQQCLNPLHLGHYVPSERHFPVELMADLIWLIGRVQTLLDAAREASKVSPATDYVR